MTSRPARPRLGRRLALLLLAVLCVVGSEVALPASSVAPGAAPAAADAPDPAAYDRAVGPADCALLGRVHVPALGCAREACVEGAVPWRRTPGAEACALPDQPRGHGFGATVPARECRALGRRWLAAVNYCASEPDRSLREVADAPQCAEPGRTYVVRREVEGAYDACVAPGHPLPRVAARSGGVLVVGDSLSWRGSDELASLAPGMDVDGEPGRRPSELRPRLAGARASAGVVVELGTNSAPGYGRRDLAAALRRVPQRTPVLLVLPYVQGPGGRPTAATRRFGGWVRSLAAYRERACVADWPAYVRAHPGLLQDGIHVRNEREPEWARWLVAAWDRCAR